LCFVIAGLAPEFVSLPRGKVSSTRGVCSRTRSMCMPSTPRRRTSSAPWYASHVVISRQGRSESNKRDRLHPRGLKVAEARKLLQQLHAESQRMGRATPNSSQWGWALGSDMPTDHQLKELMERLVNDRIQVIVMGETKNGKSTFINALLGAEVLPSANIPCTSIVCSVQYADTKYALVTRRDRQDVGAKELIDLKYTVEGGASSSYFNFSGSFGGGYAKVAPPASYGAEGGLMSIGTPRGRRADGDQGVGKASSDYTALSHGINGNGDASAAGEVASPRLPKPGDALRPYVMAERSLRDSQSPYAAVEVFWPLPLLKHQVVLTDTPGLNERASMDQIVREHLPKADAVIFLLNGTKAITDVEARAIHEVRSRLGHEHMFIVVNKTDQIDPSELDATKRWVFDSAAEMLPDVTAAEDKVLKGVPNKHVFIHFVSSTDALRAAERGEPQPPAFKALHEYISRYLNAERFKPKLLSGSAALLHALRTVTVALDGQLATLRDARAYRAAHRERLNRMAALAHSKQAKLDASLNSLTANLRDEANEGVTVASARLKGGMVRSGSTLGKYQARPQPSGPTSGCGAAGIRVPAALMVKFAKFCLTLRPRYLTWRSAREFPCHLGSPPSSVPVPDSRRSNCHHIQQMRFELDI